MNAGSGRLTVEHVIGGLIAVLAGAAVFADFGVQQRLDVLFTGETIRWLVAIVGLAALVLLCRAISDKDRALRSWRSFGVVWVVGELTIIGLAQMLPGLPTLETIQSVDLHSLDPFTQAALQWGAAWTVFVLLAFVFAGPRLNLGWGVFTWLLGCLSSAVVVATLPEEALPPLIALPIGAVWATVVFIGSVYGGPTPDATQPQTQSAPVTRAVWACLALVLLGLSLAEFESFVALDRQVNAERTATQRALDSVATGVDKLDQYVTATEKAMRNQGDVNGALFALQTAIRDVGNQVSLAYDAQQATSDMVAARAQQTSAAVERVRTANAALQALLIPLPQAGPDELNVLLGRDLPQAIATTSRETHLAQELLIGNELPTAGIFVWVAAIYSALVLLPWILFVLFLLQKRESRARESLIDLCLLDGRPAPDRKSDATFGKIEPGSLLDRVLGDGFQVRPTQRDEQPTVGQVQSALVERAFSEPEYLIGLAMLTGIIAAGWYMVFYPKGGVGIAQTIIQGADAAHLWLYLLTGLNPLTAAFCGAYFWCVYALVRRYLDSDLYPAAFLQCSVQFVLALVLSLMIAIGFPPLGQLASSALGLAGEAVVGVGSHLTGTPLSTAAVASAPVAQPTVIEAITMLLAFVGGLSISAGFTQVQSLLRNLLGFLGFRSGKVMADQARLTELEGIDSWTEARLAEEGIDNVQALANAPLHKLVLRTHFTTLRLVDWVDQALLYVHTANWPSDAADGGSFERTTGAAPTPQPQQAVAGRLDLFRALRFAGIRTATDLLGAGGWLKMTAFVNLGDALARQRTLQLALGRALSGQEPAYAAAVFTACQALIESANWVQVANFRRTSRDLLGSETKKWLEQPPEPEGPLAATPTNGLPAPEPSPITPA